MLYILLSWILTLPQMFTTMFKLRRIRDTNKGTVVFDVAAVTSMKTPDDTGTSEEGSLQM